MLKGRREAWGALIVLAGGLLVASILGLWGYMSATATPLHPNAQDVPSVTGLTPERSWADAVEQGRHIVRGSLVEQNLPGLSVAVGTGGNIVWAEGFGWADLDKKVRVAPGTPFRIGTASTALTSAAVGLLLEQGRLKLDDVIQTYVPAFPQKPWPVTLRQLMGHEAGVPSDSGDEGPLFSEHCDRPVDALPFFAKDALRFEPGTQFRFSRYGWILMSAAVEAAADEPFLLFMQKQVFEPLGMEATTVESATGSTPERATSYFPRFAADPRYGLDPMRPLDYSCYAGSSVFLSTPTDLVRFAMGINSGKLLQPATVQLLQTSQRLPSGEQTGYGLGWDLETPTVAGRQTHAIGHDGDSLGGTVTSFMTFPEHRLVVAVTSNTSYADTYSVAVKVAQAFVAKASPASR
jgi:serine beta-lactamase-like protein LACTB, mitochondrial